MPGLPLVRLAVIVATVDLVMVLVVFLMPLPVTVTLPAPRPPTLIATLVLPTFLEMHLQRAARGLDGDVGVGVLAVLAVDLLIGDLRGLADVGVRRRPGCRPCRR